MMCRFHIQQYGFSFLKKNINLYLCKIRNCNLNVNSEKMLRFSLCYNSVGI